MKKFFLPAISLVASLLTAQAQYFTNGNLVVFRLSGNDLNTNNGAAIFIDQYTTGGSLATSFAVPTTGANSIIQVGLSYAGLITLTPDNGHLLIPGYNIALASSTSQLNFTTGTVAPRSVATLDAYGNFSVPIKTSTVFSGYTLTGAASDGTNYWILGNGPPGEFATGVYPEVVYVGTASAATAVQVATNAFTSGPRGLNVYKTAGNYGLYACGFSATNYGYNTTPYGSGGFLLSNLSGVLPASPTGSTNLFPDGTSSAGTGCDLAINPAGTIAYLADLSFGVIKYTNNGSGWISNYTVQLTNAGYTSSGGKEAISVTADWSQSPPVVYATTAETYTNRLVKFSDTNGSFPAVINLAFGNIVSGAGGVTNTFRGVRFAPTTIPVITVPPVAFTTYPGQTATFSATVIGIPTPALQWYSNSPANPTYVAIPGATTTNLTLTSVTTNQNGSQFYLFASNTFGTTASIPVTLAVNDPAIVSNPIGATNFPGGSSVSLCVSALGSGTLTYQWLSNGIPIAGAQSSCYTAPSSAVSNTSLYSVIVSNSLNESITSAPAIVSYTPYLLYDTFSYPNGNLFGDPGSPWTDINGSNPELVTNGRVQISVSNATTDAQSFYDQPVSSSIVWASFTLNVSQLPSNIGGVYFANFEDTNFGFYGRIFLLTSNAPGLTPGMSPIAYPGTYRLGIANAQNDSTATSTTGPSAVVELDMAPGIDYQVVELYDMNSGFCQLAVNPSQSEGSAVYFPNGPNALTSGYAQDTFSASGLPMAAYGLRQRTGGGVMQMDNLEVSYDWNGSFSGFAAVTSAFAPAKANIGFLTHSFTNYSGNSNVLEVAASGIDLTYAWYQGGVALTDGNSLTGSATAALTINPEAGTNSGNYTVVITNSAGSVTSAVVAVSINTTPTAPSFTAAGGLEPVGTTIPEGGSVTFTATAVGTGPITYAWNYDGTPTGATGSSLTLSGVSTNQAGSYSVTATGAISPAATSSNAILIVTGPVTTNIHFLRSLISPSTFAVSDTTTLYTIQGTVINATNLTSGNTASYYLQDATGGINLFVTGDSTFRPALGDIVTATGVLSTFDDNLELDITSGAAFQTYTDLGAGSGLPSPALLSWNTAVVNPSSTVPTIEGSLVTMTNVYFETAGNFATATVAYPVTNSSGQAFTVFVTGQPNNLDGLPIPAFAYSVTGVLDQISTTTYELTVTRYSDIVTTPPPAVNVTAALTGAGRTNVTLKWISVPNDYTYSIRASTNVAGPYTNLASGLLFSTTNGTYTDVGPASTTKFYEITSP
jgi:hypothetical protein